MFGIHFPVLDSTEIISKVNKNKHLKDFFAHQMVRKSIPLTYPYAWKG